VSTHEGEYARPKKFVGLVSVPTGGARAVLPLVTIGDSGNPDRRTVLDKDTPNPRPRERVLRDRSNGAMGRIALADLPAGSEMKTAQHRNAAPRQSGLRLAYFS
jgi:hypothetical protein